MRSTQRTPDGIRVCGHQPLTAEGLAAVDELARLVRAGEERRRAALTDEERAAEDARHEEAEARRHHLTRHLRGLE